MGGLSVKGIGADLADASKSPTQDAVAELVDPPFFLGVIHDVFSHTGAYIVRIPHGRTRMGVMLAEVSDTPLGAREIRHLQIGDAVLCVASPHVSHIYIIGVVPAQLYDPRFVVPDSLVMRSMVGILQDQMHNSPYAKEDNNLANFSGGRPLDTLEGDWGFINELGAAIWLGKLMTQMRASDVAKMEMFWGDDLVRLFGWNFELFTGGRETRCYDDEGEYIEIDRWTPFGWEALGAYKTGVEIFEDNEGESGGAKKGNEKSRYEPKEAKQIMVFRGQDLRGYIGNGVTSQIAMTPVDGEELATADDELDFRGLSEFHRDLDGSIHLRSAKQVILEKSLIMPVPRQLLDPDAPDGDTGTGEEVNYKPANFYGTGGPEQERKPYEWDDDKRPDARNTDLWDYHAYLFGTYALAVIDDHEKDWTAPEEADLKIDDSKKSEIDSDLFSEALKFTFARDLPKYGEVTIDKREGHKVRYYQTKSCIHLADDGSVIIEDGYGSQIHMSAGNIHFTCQGDVFTRPGRSAITWAPRDIINRAGWCAELTAAKKDVRIKGENNVHVLAGDDTKGCLLLECRAQGKPDRGQWTGAIGTDIESRGIIVKAPESAVDVWSKNIFIGTSKDEDGVLELSAGKGSLILAADEIGNEALSKFGVLVSATRSRGSGIQFNMESGLSRLISKFDVVGDLGLWNGSRGAGNLTMDGTVHSARNGLFAGLVTANAMSAAGISHGGGRHVGEGGSGPQAPNSNGPPTESRAETFKSTVYAAFDGVTLDNSSIGPGNKEMQDAIGFSFRTSDQYKAQANDFIVFESRWQQLYRVNGALKQWEEPVVKAPDGSTETRPHPGHDAWKGDGYYKYTQSPKNVELKTGVAKSRDQQSEEEQALTEGSLLSQYVINIQEEE